MSMQLEAIVLKSFAYQEHHKIVKMISPSHGLISVFVNYANKKKSRYSAITQPLTCVTINVRIPLDKRDGLYFLVHGDIIDSFYEIKVDYEKVMMFYEMAEVIVRGDIDEYHLPYVYKTLKAVLEVDVADDMKFRFGVIVFKAKMMVAVGLLPAVDSCVGCETTSKIVTASVSEGGLVCEDCYTGNGIWIVADLIPLWRALFKLPIESLIRMDVKISDVCTFETWMSSYYKGYSNIKFAKRLEV